jgi:hypothetical protein
MDNLYYKDYHVDIPMAETHQQLKAPIFLTPFMEKWCDFSQCCSAL